MLNTTGSTESAAASSTLQWPARFREQALHENLSANVLQRFGQIDLRGVGPQSFQAVERPGVFVKQMNHNRAVVQHDPAAVIVAINVHSFVIEFVFELVIDLFAHRVQLAATGSGRNHEIIENRGVRRHVHHDDVRAAVFGSSLGSGQRQRQAVLRIDPFCSRARCLIFG